MHTLERYLTLISIPILHLLEATNNSNQSTFMYLSCLSFVCINMSPYFIQRVLKFYPESFSETLTDLNKLKHRFGGMPHDRDLQGAAKALIRLRSTYKFDLEHFSHGNIHGLQTGAQLTTKDSFFLGKFAFSNGNFAEAQKWLEFAAWQVAADTDEASNHTTSNNGGVSSDQVDSFLRDVR